MMDKFYKLVEMAMDFQDKPDVWNPRIKAEIESGEETIAEALPSQEYLELIHSEEYIQLINRITRLTGIREEEITTQSVPSIIGRAGQAFGRIQQIEARHADRIKQLAIETVFELDEFDEIAKLYREGKVKIDIQLGGGEMQRDVPQQLEQQAEEEAEQLEDPEETTEMEQDEAEVAEELMGKDDQELRIAFRKRLENSLMQGAAVHKFGLYHLKIDELNRIDPQLVSLYGITTTLPQLAYHHAPDFMFPGQEGEEGGEDMEGQGPIGSESLSFDENGVPIIKVRGITFPLLCHELVKGIYELLSYHHEETEVGVMNPKVERKDTLHGVPLWKKFAAAIPTDKQKLTPRIYKKFVKLADTNDGMRKIKAVFAGGPEGQRVMTGIVREIEAELEKHKREVEDWEREQEEGEPDEDRGF